MPRASKIGLFTNPEDAQLRESEAACRTPDVKIVAANGTGPEDIDDALRGLASEEVDLVIVLQTTLRVLHCRQNRADRIS
jgi:hypothetical protein